MIFRDVIEHLLSFLIKTILLLITFFLTWCMHIYNNDITPATSQHYTLYDNLSLTNSTLFTADTIL